MLTRKMLRAMGIEEEKIEQIMEAHGETVDALKEQRDQYRVDAEKLPEVQKELDNLKAVGDGGYKDKYDAEHAALEKLKADIAEEKVTARKSDLYRKLLEDISVDPERIDSIMRVTDLKALNIKDDKLEDEDKLKEQAKADWAGFRITTKTNGASVENPPGDGGNGEVDLGSMSMKDYIAARQKM